MQRLYNKHQWLAKMVAADPGNVRLQKAGKATASLIFSIFTTLLIMRYTGHSGGTTPAIVSGMLGLMGIMVVMDDTKKEMRVTTILLGLSAMLGITVGSLVTNNAYYIDVVLVVSVFSSFYFSRFGTRYFSLFMIFFMTVYFSSVLKLSSNQLPWFYIGIWVGVVYAFILNFFLFQDTAKNLKRSIHSFHIQSNLTLNLLIEAMKDKNSNLQRKEELEKNVAKLRDYALIVSGYINENDVKKIWPGLLPNQLRLYVFDTGMLIETLVDSVRGLKTADALQVDEIKKSLIAVTIAVRDAEVLAPHVKEQNILPAEKSVQQLRILIMTLFEREEPPQGWIYLIRRIESIANHVIEGAVTIQQSLYAQSSILKEEDIIEKAVDEDTKTDDRSLKPSTKKAYQALVAGILSIIVGLIISPAQPYWVLLTAFVVLLGTESIGRIYTKGYQRSLGTIIGAVIGFGLARLLSGHTILEVIFLFLVVFLAFYLMTVSYTLMSVFITMLIAFMYDLLLGGITFSLISARVLDTIAGASIALVVSYLIFPKKTKVKVAESINEFLEELAPFVSEYVRGFREDVNVKNLSESAFKLDTKLQTIRDEAQSFLQRPGSPIYSDMVSWMTRLAAINYYAKHLVASAYRKGFEYPEELLEGFIQIETKLKYNIDSLSALLTENEGEYFLQSLDEEREKFERLAPSRKQSQRDLIHHLYYVWRINQSLVELGIELGGVTEKK
ncbi:FUSC family protein [Fictibacillus phosphorivorans]|uniref:FUSC family protein n=1 Tax=Fictibacillus phosphorivorans TaxID=1221500 RepID=UPI002AD25760|nr:FUSC family protein [Fictibacillus phosphorivorans]